MSLPDRIIGALRRLIREELSGRANGSGEVTAGAYLGQWEYTVAEATDTTIDVRAADSACPLPDIPKVPIFPGIAGVRYRPAVGSIVGIGFANGDPTKPRIIWADQTVPVTVSVDGTESVTIGASLTPLVSSSDNVCVSPGTVPAPPQHVALAPAVQSFANATFTLCGALATFGTAAEATIPGAGAALATAATAAAGAISVLGGDFPTGFSATKLTTQ